MIAAHVGRRYPFLLDAGESARPSYAGSDPIRQLVVERDGRAVLWGGRSWQRAAGDDPIDAIGRFVDESGAETRSGSRDRHHETRVPARTVGYLAYELGAFIEDVRAVGIDLVGAPLAVLSTYARVDAIDPVSGASTSMFTP